MGFVLDDVGIAHQKCGERRDLNRGSGNPGLLVNYSLTRVQRAYVRKGQWAKLVAVEIDKAQTPAM